MNIHIMEPYVVCYTCGRSLGDLYKAYILAITNRRKEYMEKSGIKVQPSELVLSSELNIKSDDILNGLQLERMCCRRSMMTFVPFKNTF
jgi:DNA-directed RNA polymerase subunit N (RpoN/RPB10)